MIRFYQMPKDMTHQNCSNFSANIAKMRANKIYILGSNH